MQLPRHLVAGQLLATYTNAEKVTDFRSLFLVSAAVGLAAAVLLLLFFHPPAKADTEHQMGTKNLA